MGWLSTLFGSKRNRPADRPRSPSFRPRVEELEDRRLLNVSPVFDGHGHFFRLVVHDNGSLTLTGSAGYHVLAKSGVRVAHGFRDARGNLGMDIVYTNGKAFEIDSFGARLVGSKILDLSRAYDAFGNSRLEVLVNDGSGFTGILIQRTNGGKATKLATGVKWATAYEDFAGHFGLAFATVDAVANELAVKRDSAGRQVLYQGSFVITQALGDYDQALDPRALPNINLEFGAGLYTYIDEVRNPGNAGGGSLGSPHTAVEFGPMGLRGFGFNIMAN
jgi:hypothetical protein